mmetsp:Transcript_1734/g.1840  ORF Transcript_1734/g.1840 Transcript_1734/m.1840 type:complete len:340 (+) Transcript_1734:48-1067(+)
MGNCFSVDDEEDTKKQQKKKQKPVKSPGKISPDPSNDYNTRHTLQADEDKIGRTLSNSFHNLNPREKIEEAEKLKTQGNEYFHHQDYSKALQCYTVAIKLNENNAIYFSNRARCFKSLARYQEAIEDCNRCCELDDTFFKAYLIKGCSLLELSKTELSPESARSGVRALRLALQICRETNKETFLPELQIYYRKGAKLSFVKRAQQHRARYASLKDYFKTKVEEQPPTDFLGEELMDFLEETSNQYKPTEIPDHLTCSITFEMLKDPIVIESGHTYEETAIESHFKQLGHFDPSTRRLCSRSIMYKNIAIDKAVNHFIDQFPWAFQPDEEEDACLSYEF